jgi:4-amino-4-deoxychorismate lyase
MTVYWYNGKLIFSPTIELDIYDPGFLYGATVFTTLRVYNNSLDSRLTNWSAHCDRLKFSLHSFHWPEPNWELVRRGAEILLAHYPVLRITIFPDGRELIIGRFLPPNLTSYQTEGIKCVVATAELGRSLPGHKTGNYLSPWLAKNQATDAQEAILVDAADNWLETSTGNLWGWKDGTWWTPPLTAGILPGVVRQQILNHLENQQIICQQEPWSADIVQGFEAIAYTNSVVELIPIHTVQYPTGSLQYHPHHPSLQQLRSFF